MNVDVLIIGQGISGTCLSYFLEKENISFLVIDDANNNAPSRVAAGIINPVTGRRIVRTWMIEELLEFSLQFYTKLGDELNIKAISQKQIIDFFPSPQMKLAFEDRFKEGETYLQKPVDENSFLHQFNYDFGYGMVSPSYSVHLQTLLPAWRNKLINQDQLLEETFDITQLKIEQDAVYYKDITAQKIIFCDGVQSYQNNFFNKLPFAPNKGEMLIVEIPELSTDYFYKKGMVLAPLSESGLFWLGSNYLWEFEHENPTKEFYLQAEQLLQTWLKLPFKILEHRASVRPATIERRPFVGFHPKYSSIGILNGMGTKGCSLAPYFAKQLSGNICSNKPILPEVNISRFKKILSP
ncbi:MAG: FAD-binding oxidoreductase [Bacteroidetes bacterium]|nr:MAG: FAD-binding oxidoreductase [Bacteroidota bacterium]